MATQTTTSTQGHGGAREPFPPFDTAKYGTQLLWLAITFGLLYVLAAKVLLPRVQAILDRRRDQMAGDLAAAEKLKADSETAKASYEKALADAKANATRLAQETRDGITREFDARRASVEADLGRRIAEAETRIAAAKDKAMGDLGTIAQDTTSAILDRLVGPVVGRADVAGAVSDVLKR